MSVTSSVENEFGRDRGHDILQRCQESQKEKGKRTHTHTHTPHTHTHTHTLQLAKSTAEGRQTGVKAKSENLSPSLSLDFLISFSSKDAEKKRRQERQSRKAGKQVKIIRVELLLQRASGSSWSLLSEEQLMSFGRLLKVLFFSTGKPCGER